MNESGPSAHPRTRERKARAGGTQVVQTDLFGGVAGGSAEAEEAAEAGPKIYSVAELASLIKDQLRDSFGRVCVQGEIADFKGVHRNGHLYCSIKDADAQMRVVMWRNALAKVPFDIKQGLEVVITGTLDFYGGSGSLQINVERMEPLGIGALQLKFEQLKEKLAAEGLFDEARKRPVRALNWRIGLVTGKSTAALQDMLRVYANRFPLAEVFLFHASVQGEQAPKEIAAAIELANRWSETQSKPLEVLVVGRGGGSYEDLFCFNDERVARAIVQSRIPVVSAVGHEIDFTIADFVADRRAATPSNAAELTVPDRAEWLRRLREIGEALPRRITDRVNDRRLRVDHLTNRLLAAAPQRRLAQRREFLATRHERLLHLMSVRLERRRTQVLRLSQVLDALSPLKILGRGYSLVSDSSGKALRSAKTLSAGQKVDVRLHDGSFRAQVDTVTIDK